MIIRLLPLVLFTALPTAMGADAWKVPEPAAPDAAQLTGAWGAAQARSAYRMAAPPLDKSAFILDDVALKQHRKYAEWSGDISGRWIGAAAFLRPQYPKPLGRAARDPGRNPGLPEGRRPFWRGPGSAGYEARP